MAGESASQLLMVSTLFSGVIMSVILLSGCPLMGLLFGKVERDVMDACMIYLRISAYSYPALAIYNAGAVLFRSIRKQARRGGAVWHIADCRQWHCPEHLVAGSPGMCDDGTGVYYGDWSVHGKPGHGAGRILFSETF